MAAFIALLGAAWLVGGGVGAAILLRDLWPLPAERADIIETIRFASPVLTVWAMPVAVLFAMAAYMRAGSTVAATPPAPQPEPVPAPFSSGLSAPPPPQVVHVHGTGGNVLAALLTFLLPGLGHLCQGRIISAIGLVFAALLVFVVGLAAGNGVVWLIGLPLVYLAAIVDCANYDPRKGRSSLG